MQLSRRIIDALLPGGALWHPEPDEGLDQLLRGIADNKERTRVFLRGIADIRNPLKTHMLDDLEREFGQQPDAALSEDTRRQRLQAAKGARICDGSPDSVQEILRAAGFDVYVHANSPAVDPALFLAASGGTQMGRSTSMFGRAASIFGGARGELIASTPVFYQQERVVMPTPTLPQYWPLIFFVGGAATRNGAGELTAIETANVPASRRAELVRLIVKYKGMHAWAGLLVKYV